jgi:hypothetical protein
MLEWWFAIQRRCYAAGSPVHIFAYKLKLGPRLRYPAALTVESLAAWSGRGFVDSRGL